MANILVAMSGGVDSTTTAYRLKEAGHNVVGCYMKLHNAEKKHENNIRMVKKAADFLGIEYHVLDLSKEFDEIVYKPFIKAYEDGITPNPCIHCNRNIKFGALVDFAKSIGMEKLATGHYVQIKDGLLFEASDKTKDQSYFLSQVHPEVLDFMLFPLGDKYKKDIKEFALNIEELEEFSTQRESSEICFVEKSYVDILKDYVDVNKEGNVLNKQGEIVGKHQGYMHYTIGKRRGFEVKGAHDPHYVVSINPVKNEIVVGDKEDLESKEFRVTSLNMFIKDKTEFNASVKIRYRSPKYPCHVVVDADKKGATVYLETSASAIAAGQIAAFYDGEYVIASGIIL
ncbi:MAG: tRNA 2-thiouridine(34) synthase MnmA [Campylobacteraceae bacterium]